MFYLEILAAWAAGAVLLGLLVGKIIKRADEHRTRDVWTDRPQMWLERNPYDPS